jgi:hypothetical protein
MTEYSEDFLTEHTAITLLTSLGWQTDITNPLVRMEVLWDRKPQMM